jgi:hypothetical protein
VLAGDQSVTRAASSTTLVSSQNPSVFGQNVTFTATVAASPGPGATPTGSIVFVIDSVPQPAVALVAGSASLSSASLAAGAHSIEANYGGDVDYGVSTATLAGGQQVSPASSEVIVSTSGTPSRFGESVTFTAAMSAVAPGAGTPTGTVTFVIDGGAPQNVALSGGMAGLVTSTLAVGPHTIAVSYTGDANFAAAAASLAGGQEVIASDTTTTLSSSANPTAFGSDVTISAIVAPVAPGAGVPDGSVAFVVDGGAPQNVALSGGSASLTLSGLDVGNHSVAASYSGSAGFNSSNATLAGGQQINPGVPALISVLTGAGQSATIGTAFSVPLAIVVTDADGFVVPNATVQFASPASGASASFGPAVAVASKALFTTSTDASGGASVTATANTIAGGYDVVITAGPANTTLALVNLAGVASQILIEGGGSQSTPIGTAFPSQLAVRITDSGGNPIQGVVVDFSAPGSGPSAVLSMPSDTTDSNGIARVGATANGLPGSYAVSASASGIAGGVRFGLLNLAQVTAIPVLDALGLLAILLALGLIGAARLSGQKPSGR